MFGQCARSIFVLGNFCKKFVLEAQRPTQARSIGGLAFKPTYILDTVLLGDRIKVLEDMDLVVKEALSLIAHNELVCHLLSQPWSVPRKSLLYQYRVDIDLASMLFARAYWLRLDVSWCCHIRLDSSPQFGRDYLMAEMDIIYDAQLSQWSDVPAHLYTRQLVGQQIGSRAGNAATKTRKLLHMLALESAQLRGTLSRCYSVLFDCGTESAIWRSPAELLAELKIEHHYESLFGMALPIPDHDHSLHHATLRDKQVV